MNVFADSLLSLLLGWMKGLTQMLWAFFSEGASGGFLSWLGDHWLGLVLFLCAVGLTLDFVFWLRQRKKKSLPARDEARPGEEWGFGQDFGDSLEMRTLAAQEEAEAGRETEAAQVLFQEERKPLVENTEKRFFPVQGAYSEPESLFSAMTEARAAEAEPMRESSVERETRRRRSVKHEGRERKRLFRRVNALIGPDEQDHGLLDGLPPVIDKNEAFHKPVYPK